MYGMLQKLRLRIFIMLEVLVEEKFQPDLDADAIESVQLCLFKQKSQFAIHIQFEY